MGNCLYCGSFTGHPSGVCSNCESSSGRGSGTPTDVPCQRCGMYLPSHELRMWNSRLYCAYCIMDVQDEEEMVRKHGAKRPQPEGEKERAMEEGKSHAGESLAVSGECEKCGAQAGQLYSINGRRMCQRCYSEEGGAASASSAFGMIVQQVRKLLKRKEEPKIIAAPPQAAEPAPQQLFDLRERRMVEKQEGMGAQLPLSEEKSEKKKPAPKAKKFFFAFHSEKKK